MGWASNFCRASNWEENLENQEAAAVARPFAPDGPSWLSVALTCASSAVRSKTVVPGNQAEWSFSCLGLILHSSGVGKELADTELLLL